MFDLNKTKTMKKIFDKLMSAGLDFNKSEKDKKVQELKNLLELNSQFSKVKNDNKDVAK
ncbi:MAG: hypothetical protein IJ853_01165 [Rickettsiales bacterium]|nr:hypothetical protein [Rickettsiales bacterium]